ncbi:hypothetical protein HYW99_02045, partial [Candidatus Woesearchaeota archaeon]|nr:hypothetical protein [Candidatus Woesearchaeota archaeon]
NNINYNLSTLTAEVSQKASWVLQNRQGVCDELTSLFIALLRAVGIPARFVSGISYTNSPLFPEEWGPHGWAEVYFPSYGWVPFDVTYAQFGWIDPTHIKFKDSIDSDEPSTYYQWRGRNADLITKKLDIKTTLLEKRGSTEFYLIKSKEVKVVGNEIKDILLLPKEKKKLFWILKIQDFLDEKYSYTFPIIVSTLNNITSETSFTASIREKYISFEEIEEIAKLLEEEKEKRYSSNILLDCKTKKIEFFEYEDVSLHCNIKNIGNVFLENIDVCFQDKCQKTSLGISQSNNFTFEINKSYAGQKQSVVTATNELVSKTSYLNLKIKDAPKIEIKDVEFPTNVSYGDNFTVLFTIAKKSNTNPKNVEIIFNQNGIEKKWSIEELTENRKFILRFQGSQLRYRENINSIKVNYNDGLSKYYNVQKDFTIALTNATILQRLYLSPNIFGSVFERIGYRTISLMLLFGAVAFVIVVILVFRGSRKY